MNFKFSIFFLSLFITANSLAQKSSDDVLFTVDDEPVSATEFVRVYNKNLDLVKDESQKDVDTYLQLFINYKLKIKEAKRLGLDTIPTYKREFLGYKKQLSKNYMSDSNVTEALIKEAYDRMAYDIKAKHVLVRIDENEKDTLNVYNQLIDLRKRVLSEGFEKVKSEVHDGETVFAEDLGYFSAFKMVYPFENAAFSTKVGEISMPFRTRFGYHIVIVEDKRPTLGEVTVEHIMIMNNQKDSLVNPEVRINEIYKKINQGENFESLAKQFSEDKSSSDKGGLLTPFTGGQLSSQEFEKVAFSLKEKGEISKPFKSNYGWHIIKLISKEGLQPIEKIKNEVENRVKRDSRSSLINDALASKLKKQYDVKDNEKALIYFESILTPSYFSRGWIVPSNLEANKELFKVGSKTVLYSDFANHLAAVQKAYFEKQIAFSDIIRKEYKSYQEAVILAYHEENLEFVNEDFAQILKEYRDGLLLFDLMEKEVWSEAINDSIGLKTYFEKNASTYVWNTRVDVVIATAAKQKDIEKVKALMNKGKSDEDISQELNSDKIQKVIFTKGLMETSNQSLPIDLELKEGVSKIYNYNDAFHVILINSIKPASNKTFDEAKGKATSDYQGFIEENWLNTLNNRYKVIVNEDVLTKVKSQIKN